MSSARAGLRCSPRATGLFPLIIAGALAAAAAACSIRAETFTPESPPAPVEDCAVVGDEDANGAADCDDPACAGTAACAPPTCTDAVKNGAETDVDCGGACPACADGAACVADPDCASGLCGAGACARLASCRAILDAGLSRGDGIYSIDPDGVAGAPPLQVKCDMTIDGGGWTRFHWVTGPFPANLDPLMLPAPACPLTAPVCPARIPAAANPTSLMVRDLGDGDVALWKLDPMNAVSLAALAALRDKITNCVFGQPPWQPYLYTGTEAFCGTGGEGGCRAFVYVNTSFPGCVNTYTGWYMQLDGDTGCYNTAFKMGMPHTGYETIGCERPEANFLDDGPTSTDDNTGELYYR